MHALTHVYLFVDGPTFHQMALNTYYLASMLLATVSYKLTAEEAVKRTGVPHLCCSIPSGGRRRIRCSGPPHPNSCILSVRPARAAGDVFSNKHQPKHQNQSYNQLEKKRNHQGNGSVGR